MALLFLLIIVTPAVLVTAGYNRLATARATLKNAFAQIDVLITRRYDLVPNLVDTCKAYLRHEHDRLESLRRACSEAYEGLKSAAGDPGSASAVHLLVGADEQLGGALGALMRLAQSHPELSSSQALLQLIEELSSSESKLALARQVYNKAVMTYNSDRASFPGNIAAGLFGLEPAYPITLAPLSSEQPMRAAPETAASSQGN
jgi:LemA protein